MSPSEYIVNAFYMWASTPEWAHMSALSWTFIAFLILAAAGICGLSAARRRHSIVLRVLAIAALVLAAQAAYLHAQALGATTKKTRQIEACVLLLVKEHLGDPRPAVECGFYSAAGNEEITGQILRRNEHPLNWWIRTFWGNGR